MLSKGGSFIVADHGHDGQPVAKGSVQLEGVEPERSVSERRDDDFAWPRGLHPKGHGNRASDRARGAVDEPRARLTPRLYPLPELAAVGDEDGAAIEQRLKRGGHAQRVNGT